MISHGGSYFLSTKKHDDECYIGTHINNKKKLLKKKTTKTNLKQLITSDLIAL